MALLSGIWYSKNGKDLGNGAVIKRTNIDTDDRLRIDPIGIVYYDDNSNWVIDGSDVVIGALVYTSSLAKTGGIFNQDRNNPTLFQFGANIADQSKGLLVIFSKTFLDGLSFTPPPPVVPTAVKPQPAELKSNLESTLKNRSSIKDFIASNLTADTTTKSYSSVNSDSEAQNNIVLEGNENINATGNESSNTLVGNSGGNILDGGGGDDILIGGIGDDKYYVDSFYDTLVELPNEGVDTVLSSISFILPKDFENLVLTGLAKTGTGNDSSNIITGNEFANEIFGLAGDDIIDGKGGKNNLYGGIGNDTYIVNTLSDTVFEKPNEGDDMVKILISGSGTYNIPNNVERLILDDSSRFSVIGNNLSNDITGNAFADILRGGMGDDHIIGLSGQDQLYGDQGNDFLNGGTDGDKLYGGLGNDLFLVDNIYDQVIEYGAQGQDQVQSLINYVLPGNIEGLKLLGTANLSGSGNSLSNTIEGNTGNNILDGGAGKDILTGLAGADKFVFSAKPFSLLDTTADIITDFNPDEDVISISRSAFAVSIGQNSSLRVVDNSIGLRSALASDNLFVYYSTTGLLYLNQNGRQEGAGSGGVFAVLNSNLNLTTTNFSLF
jgi:Ca2+-binding RTX toxin-like protein